MRALLILAALACASCGAAPNDSPAAAAARARNDSRVIGVLVFDGVLTSDATAPLEVFGAASKEAELAGYRVVAIGPTRAPVTTEEGVRLLPHHSVADAPPLHALIVGSAYDMDPVLDDERLMAFVRREGGRARWLASNCSGARVLGEAGFLAGRKVTTYPGGEAVLKLRYPRASVQFGRRVVVDGNLVTSNGGLVSYEASLALLARMASPALAKKVASTIYYDRVAGPRRGRSGNAESSAAGS